MYIGCVDISQTQFSWKLHERRFDFMHKAECDKGVNKYNWNHAIFFSKWVLFDFKGEYDVKESPTLHVGYFLFWPLFVTGEETIFTTKMWSKLLNSLVWQRFRATSNSTFKKFHFLNSWMYNALFVLNEKKIVSCYAQLCLTTTTWI